MSKMKSLLVINGNTENVLFACVSELKKQYGDYSKYKYRYHLNIYRSNGVEDFLNENVRY